VGEPAPRLVHHHHPLNLVGAQGGLQPGGHTGHDHRKGGEVVHGAEVDDERGGDVDAGGGRTDHNGGVQTLLTVELVPSTCRYRNVRSAVSGAVGERLRPAGGRRRPTAKRAVADGGTDGRSKVTRLGRQRRRLGISVPAERHRLDEAGV
jgi:hypothetical protein